MGECPQLDLPRGFRHVTETSIFARVTASAFLKLYALTAPLIFVIDLAWLGLVAKDFYRSRLGDSDAPRSALGSRDPLLSLVRRRAAVLRRAPGARARLAPRAALSGAGLGFICYCTYDLTNLALAKGFPTSVAVVDIAWGTVLGAAVSAAAFKLAGLVI